MNSHKRTLIIFTISIMSVGLFFYFCRPALKDPESLMPRIEDYDISKEAISEKISFQK